MNDRQTICDNMFLPAFDMFFTYHKAKIQRASYFIGKVVLLSFVCEIGIKALIKFETGKLVRGHHLDVLFNKLSPELQNLIVKSTEYLDEEFYHNLKVNKNHFEKWRYHYEGCDTADLKFMQILLATLSHFLMSEEDLKYYFPESYKD